jgi:hypothetical protein
LYLYTKIGNIERTEYTEVSPNITPGVSFRSDNSGGQMVIRVRTGSGSTVSDSQLIGSVDPRQEHSHSHRTVSLESNRTRTAAIRFIYLKHAIWCAVSTITCLIIYQIFFYNYGLEFKYVGTKDELIVTFIESIRTG